MATRPNITEEHERPARISPWHATATPREFPLLDGDLVPECCVIGAGIAGLTTAYLLAREGRSVVVLEARGVAGGMSSSTSAHITCAIDDGIARVARVHGQTAARLAVGSHASAIRRIGEIVREEGIDCGFAEVPGYLVAGPGQDPAHLELEFEAARAALVPGVAMIREMPDVPYRSGPCLVFPRQAQFHPLRYLNGLADAIVRLGGHVYCRTHVNHVEEGEPFAVETDRGVVRARHVVIATNAPIHPRIAVHAKQAPQVTHIVGIGLRPGMVPPMLSWDTGDPPHYVRTMQDPRLAAATGSARELLLVGGEDHRSGEVDEPAVRQAALESWARERFGDLLGEVEFAWCGQYFRSHDNLAFMGRVPGRENLHVITGDSGQGLTHGTAGAILIADLVAGRSNPWERLYDPSRITLRAGATWARQTLSTLRCWAEWTGKGDVADVASIEPGSGAVIVQGLQHVAAYRHHSGRLHEMSAACPHLGGIVHWNSGAATWDCPCHGSRFDPLGGVLSGPACSGLRPLEPETE